jgi:hypothetical protein
MQTNAPANDRTGKLVNGKVLLELLFDEQSRPSPRWLATQIKSRAIPRKKIGSLNFFDLEEVREKLNRKNTIGAK